MRRPNSRLRGIDNAVGNYVAVNNYVITLDQRRLELQAPY